MAEVKNSRVYRTVYKSNWRDMIPRILVSGKHVNFVKIDTTGLDPMNSEMIGIVIARGHFKDNVLIPDDTFATLIRPTNPIPPEITEKNGITNEMVANAPDLSTVMMQVWNRSYDRWSAGAGISCWVLMHCSSKDWCPIKCSHCFRPLTYGTGINGAEKRISLPLYRYSNPS